MTAMTAQLPLYTSRYRAIYDLLKKDEPLPVVPVRTSVGNPRFIRESGEWPKVNELAPYGLMKLETFEELAEGYYKRLTKIGVPAITKKLHEVWVCQTQGSWMETPEEDRKPLALLCFEDLDAGERCHRRLFANWWLEHTGQVIPDLNTATAIATWRYV